MMFEITMEEGLRVDDELAAMTSALEVGGSVDVGEASEEFPSDAMMTTIKTGRIKAVKQKKL